MGKGYEINVTANTRSVLKGMSDTGGALDDVGDSLDDLTREAKRAGDKLGDGIKDGARQAGSAADRLEGDFRSLAGTVQRETKQAGDATARNIDQGTTKAKQSLNELKDEARQNASETFSSFDGSAQSFADGLQGTFGGIVSSLGPIGAVAGAAGALGIGLIISAFDQAGQSNEEFKADVAEMAAGMIEAGRVGSIGLEQLIDKLKENATLTEDQADSLERLAKHADGGGASYAELAQAIGMTSDQIQQMIDDERRAQSASEDYISQFTAGIDGTTEAESDLATQRRDNAAANIQYLEQQKTKVQEAAEQERLYAEAGGYALETRAAAAGAYQDALDDAVGAFGDFQNAETGALDPAGYIAGIQARIDATSKFNSNVQTLATQFGLTDDEVQAILDQGLDFGPMLQSIIDSGLAPQFVAQLQSAVGGGQDILNGSNLSATADVDADTKPAQDKTQAFTDTKRETTVTVKADTGKADTDIKAMAGQSYIATVQVDADLSRADSKVQSFMNRNRTITITADVKDRNGNPVY